MLGLRVRGRGGWDRTAPVAAPKSAFLWGSTPFLCARAKKWGGTGSRGEGLLPNKTAHTCKAKDKAALSLPSACAPIRWEVVDGLSCDSTPFLWCLPKETVSSRQRKALFLPRRLHHPRERCQSVDYTFLARLGARGWCGVGAGSLSGLGVTAPPGRSYRPWRRRPGGRRGRRCRSAGRRRRGPPGRCRCSGAAGARRRRGQSRARPAGSARRP